MKDLTIDEIEYINDEIEFRCPKCGNSENTYIYDSRKACLKCDTIF